MCREGVICDGCVDRVIPAPAPTVAQDDAEDRRAMAMLWIELLSLPPKELAQRVMRLTLERDLAIAGAADMQRQFQAEVIKVEQLRRELELTNRHRVEV